MSARRPDGAASLQIALALDREVGVGAPGSVGPEAEARALEGLTGDQREAVTHGEGPLLVVAGAGTGKTLVLTRRIAWLIATRRARPSEILALTFTEKAAAEMEARVDALVPYGYVDTQISTFHAFGDRLLRDHALEAGLPPDFRVLSRPEQYIFFRDRLFELPLERYRPLGDPTRYVDALLGLISRAKDEDVTADAYLAFARALAQQAGLAPDDAGLREQAAMHAEIARTYEAYQRLLREAGRVDFGDLIALPLALLRARPDILRREQARFRYLLVDEFQDTNHAQFELVKLLAAPHRNITVVGDDDQSIYKFRGAAISNILGFGDAYPDARRVVLAHNFRSVQPILDAAYRLIQHNNPDRLEARIGLVKALVAARGGGAPVRHEHFETLTDEADAVAAQIAAHVSGGGRYADCAILVRANGDADPFVRALNMRGIPWWFSGTRGLYDREEVRLALAFLRVLADPAHNLSLYYLGTSPLYLIDPTDMARALSYADRRHRSLEHVFRHLRETELGAELSRESHAAIGRLVEDLDAMRRLMREQATGRVLYEYLVTRTGYIRRLATSGQPADEVKVASLARLFDIVSRHAEVAVYDRVPEFVRRMEDLIAAGDDPPTPDPDPDFDGVNILTVHKAKGLEFPVVFLVNCVADRFPSRARAQPLELPDELVRGKEVLPSGDGHLQEERRLFYVAMTRARDRLVLTSGRDYGRVRARKVSRFVVEALDEPAVDAGAFRASPAEVIARHAPPAADPPVGLPGLAGERPLLVSFRQVDDYQTCPLKYKYAHLLRVPLLRDHRVVYGTAVHAGAMEYNRRRARGQPATLEDLYRAFETAWVTEGFISREHEDQRLAEGREVLASFLAFQQASGFTPTMVESRFAIQVGDARVRGRWDRVDIRRRPDGDDEVVIIDFKTSDVRAQKDAERRARESLQLAIYALAYERQYGRTPDRLELHFLGPRGVLVGAVTPLRARLDEAASVIEQAAAGIRRGEFTATPDYYRACRYCAFASICPYTAKED
ncbi:MAG: ATP-dependent DNA helicase [Armatimonadota bacterium]|nr:ATP-dependent DNA helicase [Armatimonadota bacterium]MDR7421749.1 ATP-dependent DNA helicase [Armatimonadota bacterium]MDR7453371.1 ATP-dependent DNA helicase [Armatimonadota bacterium]MDR7457190.1 ATP-dependent DNA helicase [Armatimonadota bacterium]MDR7496070.1 ATP-dependent DNA helicase [Armatimonadota bacterium]